MDRWQLQCRLSFILLLLFSPFVSVLYLVAAKLEPITNKNLPEKNALVIFMCEPVSRQQAELQRQTIIHTNVYVDTN